MAAVTQKQLDLKIRTADGKIEKYKGYIAKLNLEKKSLLAQKRKLEAEKAKPAKAAVKKPAGKANAVKKTSAAKKTAAKKQTSILEGILDEVNKSGGAQGGNLLEMLLDQLKGQGS